MVLRATPAASWIGAELSRETVDKNVGKVGARAASCAESLPGIRVTNF
jgi:hypothetical protein